MKIKMEDIAFWVSILAALAIVIWFFHGSPTVEQTLLSLTVLIITSEFLLWKKYYMVDKKSAVSFAVFKGDLTQIKGDVQEIKRQQERLEVKIDEIRKKI